MKTNNELFLEAVYRDDLVCIKLWLDNGADIETKNKYGYTALAFTASHGRVKALQILLAAGANTETPCGKGPTTALMGAAEFGQTETLKILLAAGANINAKTTQGWTALFSAAYSGQAKTIEILLAAGINKDAQTNEGVTPLMYAARNYDDGSDGLNYDESVRFLLAAGANVAAQTSDGKTALTFAAENDEHIEIAKMLKHVAQATLPLSSASPNKQKPIGLYNQFLGFFRRKQTNTSVVEPQEQSSFKAKAT